MREKWNIIKGLRQKINVFYNKLTQAKCHNTPNLVTRGRMHG